jgi:hypothetical protein
MSVILNGTNGIVFNDGTSQTTSAYTGFRNRIINGDMRIDQRNAGASVNTTTTATNVYTLDRWAYIVSATSKFTVQRDAGGITPPAGFTNYLGCTSTAATSVGSSDYFQINQSIEGFNIADLSWGTANAKTITLSFWVRSSLTGTFGGSLRNSAIDRSYPFSYTISSANTWEQKSITIAGDTSGTWLTTNGIGIRLAFGLGMGSTFSGTAGAWATGNLVSATGATSVVGVSGATLYITGVQFEVGSTASPFEIRPYPVELILCQRYYEIGGSSTTIHFSGNVTSAGTYFASIPFRVEKRVAPTSTSTANVLNLSFPATASTVGAVSAYEMRTQRVANASAVGYFGDTWTAGAEL